MIKKILPFSLVLGVLISFISGCTESKTTRGKALYEKHCTNCHIGPQIADLPKHIWATSILPDMAARMGIREEGYDPLQGLSYEEMDAVIKTGIFPLKRTISYENWGLLREYIISMAPDSLPRYENEIASKELLQFEPNTISLDATKRFSFTYLEHDQASSRILLGDMGGELLSYDKTDGLTSLGVYNSPVISYIEKDAETYVTTIGYIHPSAIPKGQTLVMNAQDTIELGHVLHRPVHMVVSDLNTDGDKELVISEFGDLTGRLSLFIKNDFGAYDQKYLLNQPGTIRVVSRDMDNDGKEDLVALTSQGDESITILYQKENLQFVAEKVLRFSPVYGSSWFEIIDYDGDGDFDIITVHGDNADKSYVQKPYHGMRIHLNDGFNTFEEQYFYPLNGATRVVASDFDTDGDIDFGLLSTFPDYVNAPERSFVYLENTGSSEYLFEAYTFTDSKKGKWFLMDKGDLDEDGDEDIILSGFALPFIPAPKHLESYWREQSVDLILLDNQKIK
jgi:hypothetical protein